MGPVVSVSPFRCRVWRLHDRLEEHITEDTCKAEIDSFVEHGQLVPVLGRRLHDDPSYDVELVYGARRLFVARHINKPLQVELCDLSDRDAIVAMDMENRQRKDISPYERGLSYARWLRTGYFGSQEDIAQALNISSSQVSRLLKVARLPSVVVAAFNNAVEICEGWGLNLAEALEDPARRSSIIQTARMIGASETRPSGREVYQRLMAAAVGGRKPRKPAHDKVITDARGAPLFRVQYRSSAIALLLPVERISAKLLETIESAVICAFQAEGTRSALRAARGVERASGIDDATGKKASCEQRV